MESRAVVIPGTEGIADRVVRKGLPCQTAPSVEVTRDHASVAVAIDRGPSVGEDGCPDSEDFSAVDLVFVGADGIDTVDARVWGPILTSCPSN